MVNNNLHLYLVDIRVAGQFSCQIAINQPCKLRIVVVRNLLSVEQVMVIPDRYVEIMFPIGGIAFAHFLDNRIDGSMPQLLHHLVNRPALRGDFQSRSLDCLSYIRFPFHIYRNINIKIISCKKIASKNRSTTPANIRKTKYGQGFSGRTGRSSCPKDSKKLTATATGT